MMPMGKEGRRFRIQSGQFSVVNVGDDDLSVIVEKKKFNPYLGQKNVPCTKHEITVLQCLQNVISLCALS